LEESFLIGLPDQLAPTGSAGIGKEELQLAVARALGAVTASAATLALNPGDRADGQLIASEGAAEQGAPAGVKGPELAP
jgi:hypothetical protein